MIFIAALLIPIALILALVVVLILMDTKRRHETLKTINVEKAKIAARKRGQSDQ